MSKVKPYIDKDGEVRELDDHFFANAKRGRPALPDNKKKKRVNVSLDRDLVDTAKAKGLNLSRHVNDILRKELGL